MTADSNTQINDLFAEFFSKFQFRLNLEMGPRSRATVDNATIVKPLENYSTQWAKC